MSLDANDWRVVIEHEWAKRRAADIPSTALFPLAVNPFGAEEILAMTDVLLSGRLTLGENVEAAERDFAAAVGAPYAVMVNSGSSANLLMVSAIVNPQRPVHCVPGDEVFVPSVCWSTSVAPLLQSGLVPVFVDANPCTFNIEVDELQSLVHLHPRARAIMAVHVLGNSTDMRKLQSLVARHNLILIEDTCESLGSTAFSDDPSGVAIAKDAVEKIGGMVDSQLLGTFGQFGSFSFYFSHHITSGEGGMVICKTEADYNFLRCLRAHGWTRHLTNRQEVEALHPTVDPRFMFVNVGFNLRPMEVQGAMLRVQIRKLAEFNACRRDNLTRIEQALCHDERYSKLMTLMKPGMGTSPAWFGVGVVLHRAYAHQLRSYMAHLDSHGVENRPIISGNFVRQPLISSYLPDLLPEDFPGAEVLHTRGFFIGVHQIRVTEEDIQSLVDVMLGFAFQERNVVLVTGSNGMLGRHVQAEIEHLVNLDQGKVVGQNPKRFVTFDAKLLAHVDCSTAEPMQNLLECTTEWVLATRHDGDLSDMKTVEQLFKKYQPTHVLHLAAHVQSLHEMTLRPVDFWLNNVTINNNVLSAACKFQAWSGRTKVVSVLSTLMFSSDATYPVDASQALAGTLHTAGEGYGLSKRALAYLSRWYRKQHSSSYSTVLPGNFYGAYGDFHPPTAPLVNALIAKADSVCDGNSSCLQVMGTGKPRRQIMHASDLARVLIWAVYNLDQEEPLVVAGEEYSIEEIAGLVAEATGIGGTDVVFDRNLSDGPLSRTADLTKFSELCPTFVFKSLSQGLAETVEWYRSR